MINVTQPSPLPLAVPTQPVADPTDPQSLMEQDEIPHHLIAAAAAVTMLAAGCSSGGSGSGTTGLKLEKTNIVVNAFPAIDSAGLYIAQDQGLFAAQGLNVTIVPVQGPRRRPPRTW